MLEHARSGELISPRPVDPEPGATRAVSLALRTAAITRHPVVRSAALVGLLLLDVFVPLAYAHMAERVLPTLHLDGSFQTASGLFRLSAGQWPGKDFFPYLGIGPVFTLFPAYLLRGSTLAATVFSARLMSLLSVELIFGVVAVLAFRRRSPWVFALAAAVPAVVIQAVTTWHQPGAVNKVCGNCMGLVALAGDPGNSLRPIRAVVPYVLALVAYLVLRSRWRASTRSALVGAAAGIGAALWSNDYALVSGVGLLVVVTLYFLLSPDETRGPRPVLVQWGAAALAYFAAGFATTAGHFFAYLSYNFSDVRADQFWYFPPWQEHHRVYSVGDLLRMMSVENAVLPAVLLVAVAVLAVVRRELHWLLLAYVGGAVFLGGLISTYGGHGPGYFWALVLWGYVTVAVVLARLISALLARPVRLRLEDPWARALPVGLAAVLVLVLVATDHSALTDERRQGRKLAAEAGVTYVPALGGYIDERFIAHIDAFDGRGSAVVEEYMGLAGALHVPRADVPVDSVIAALGEQRQVVAAEMARRPAVVVTSAPALGPWVSWSLSVNWWFYRSLFQSYAPVQDSPTTVVWTPTTPAAWVSVPCRVHGQQIELDAAQRGLYEVTLHYRGPGRSARAVSLVQNNINVVDVPNYTNLDPGARVQRFPVAVRAPGSGRTVLHLRNVSSHPGKQLTTLNSCTATSISIPAGAQTAQVFTGLF